MENNQSFQPWGVYFYPISREPINVVKIVNVCSSGCYVRDAEGKPKFWVPGSCLWVCDSLLSAIRLYLSSDKDQSYSGLVEDLSYRFSDSLDEIFRKG